MRSKIEKISLSIKFSLTVGLILLLFCTTFSVILYYYLKNQMLNDAEEKTMIIMSQIKAVGNYVRETLRPAMYSKLHELGAKDVFIIEAMSTTHVSLQVMERFNKDFQSYRFRRVSDNPLNKDNQADPFHVSMLNYFRSDNARNLWKGTITTDKGKESIRVRPIYMETGCERCHSRTKDAPKQLIQKYGIKEDFQWKVGDVIGVESVSVPIDYALADVKRIAIDTFFLGLSTLGILFLTLYGTFRHLVTKPLQELSATFKRISEGKESLGRDITSKRTDEIGELTNSFSILSRHLLEAEQQLKKTAEIEKQMMETEKFSALGRLSAGVAHEINNPLGGIKLCFNNLMTIQMDDETRKKHIEVIKSGFERIRLIVTQLLDFAKDSPLSQSRLSINNIITNVLNLTDYTLSKVGITIKKDFCDKMPELLADANKLEQVFLNLIINAIQAMPDGGVLKIKTWCEYNYCKVSISDTGKGIPETIKTKIFDPFFTTKGVQEGTGLGLTVSKAIVEQHGGLITYCRSDGETIFTVSLPIDGDANIDS